MAATTEGGADDFAQLARNLQAAGEAGLKRELYDAVNAAAKPLADEIQSEGNLHDHLPNRYADVLAEDMRTLISKRTAGSEVGVFLQVSAPTRAGGRGRKVTQRNRGVLWHPVFDSYLLPRRTWTWRVQGFPSVRPGFVDDPAERAKPEIRQQIEDAIARVKDELWNGIH